MIQNYNNNFSQLRISKFCKLVGVKIRRLLSVKGFDDENGQLRTCNMFMVKQCRNKICKMSHLLLKDMDKAYPEQLVKMLSTGLAAAVTKSEGGKKG